MLRLVQGFPRCALVALLLLSAALRADAAPKYTKALVDYPMPDVTVLNQDGVRVRLQELARSDKPVLVDFIFATCTTICPVLSANFASFQKKLGADTRAMHLVSFTIDPENDTPEILKDYGKKFAAKPGWDFMTGSRKTIDAVMKAFDAYVPDKMNHIPVTFIKAPGKAKWVRLYGLMGTADLYAEVQQALKP